MSPLELALFLVWTLEISGYGGPDIWTDLPEVEYVSQEFFEENACGGNKCPIRVLGWYKNDGTIYLWEHLDLRTPKGQGIVIHELTHYAQDMHGNYDEMSCEDNTRRELEAYNIEDMFMFRFHGVAPPNFRKIPRSNTCPLGVH